MKKHILIGMLIPFAFNLFAQQVANFEDVTLDSGKVLNGLDGETAYKFLSDDLTLPVFWDTSYGGYWSSGWAISKKLDSASIKSNSGKHLYCAKTATGANGSKAFAVGQNGSWFTYKTKSNLVLTQFKITNSTYAYNSMKFGDLFGKKFGGTSGKDTDFFFVRVKSWMEGKLKDSQDIYLADFRFNDSTKDYILRDWKSVYFTPGRFTDSVTFDMFSSDTGRYGMNTPGFFAIDDIHIDIFENTNEITQTKVTVYPNPANGSLSIASDYLLQRIQLVSTAGNLLLEKRTNTNRIDLDVSHFLAGTYFIYLETIHGKTVKTIIINH